MMFPYWYERQRKIEYVIMLVGFLFMVAAIFTDNFFSWYISAFFIMAMGPILQRFRFKRLEKLEADPLRCECGGHFVTPWELGFDGPTDYLICDNENGNGPGIACENWIVIPHDHPALQNIGETTT